MDELANATLERLREILRPMDGAQVLAVRPDGFTLRFERVYSPTALGSVGTEHAYAEALVDEATAWSDAAVFQGVVAEDDDFVYSGAGSLDHYDDEGCGGEFDVDVYVVPVEERYALVDELVRRLRERAKAASAR